MAARASGGREWMRVLVLTQYFWPEPIPKPLELAKALRDEGHSVQVVTGFPNYPEGRLYPGFGVRVHQRDTVEGFPVCRMLVYPDHGTGLLGRMLNYASFMISGVIGGLLAAPFDVIYVWHPPLSVGVTAAVISLIRRRGFVYDVQDIWPESAIATGFLRPGRLARWMASVERFVYRRAAHILVVTQGAKANLAGKGVPEDKITVASHWYDATEPREAEADSREEIRHRERWNSRFVVMFAGNMGILQGLDTVIQAARELPPDSNVLLALVGDGAEKPRLVRATRELGLEERIQFLGRRPLSEMAGYFAAADALLVHLRASPIAPLIVPTKTIAYLAAGKPIVLASVGAAADIVSHAQAGLFVSPDDPVSLGRAITKMAHLPESEREAMGRRGRMYFEANFTRQVILPTYIDVLRRVAAAKRRARDQG